jgi:hypothetical protein
LRCIFFCINRLCYGCAWVVSRVNTVPNLILHARQSSPILIDRLSAVYGRIGRNIAHP